MFLRILLLTFFISMPFAPSAKAMVFGRLTDSLKAAKDACAAKLDEAFESAGKTLIQANEGLSNLHSSFQTFMDTINFDGVASGVAGGGSGLKILIWNNLSAQGAMGVAAMAMRILNFESDVDSLREGMFQPMTDFLVRYNNQCSTYESLSPKERVEQQVIIYGELIILTLEMVIKTYRLIPQIVVSVVPTSVASFLPIFGVGSPTSVDQLFVIVMRKFIANAFKALTSSGLSLEERVALLSFDMATVEATGQFAKDAGIQDFLAALGTLRATSSMDQISKDGKPLPLGLPPSSNGQP